MLTARQKELFEFIKGYIAANGVAPSISEMQTALKMKARGGIHAMLKCLEDRGVIRRIKYRSRAIEVVERVADGALVSVVEVCRADGGSDFLVFSDEEKAKEFATTRPEPCVISDRVIDFPERYYGVKQ